MLMIGHDMQRRATGAKSLLRKGYASLLMIPARNKVLSYNSATDTLVETGWRMPAHVFQDIVRQTKNAFLIEPENTQVEFRIGLELMNRLSLNSAIIVSSPYHMRRIRMIVLHEARNSGKRFIFVPADANQKFDPLWIFDLSQVKWIVKEYIKIVWFLFYESVELIL